MILGLFAVQTLPGMAELYGLQVSPYTHTHTELRSDYQLQSEGTTLGKLVQGTQLFYSVCTYHKLHFISKHVGCSTPLQQQLLLRVRGV